MTGVRTLACALIAIMATVPAPSAFACSPAANTEQNFAAEVARMPYVFVARFVDYRQSPPGEGETLGRNEIAWELIESLKGDPPVTGILAETNPRLHHPGTPSGPACGPFVATPDHLGKTALVIASDSGKGRGQPWAPSHFSQILDSGAGIPASSGIVRKTRQLIGKETTPP